MNAEAKLFLLLLVVLVGGIALVAIGCGMTTKTAAFAAGVLVYIAALRGLTLLWKGRP